MAEPVNSLNSYTFGFSSGAATGGTVEVKFNVWWIRPLPDCSVWVRGDTPALEQGLCLAPPESPVGQYSLTCKLPANTIIKWFVGIQRPPPTENEVEEGDSSSNSSPVREKAALLEKEKPQGNSSNQIEWSLNPRLLYTIENLSTSFVLWGHRITDTALTFQLRDPKKAATGGPSAALATQVDEILQRVYSRHRNSKLMESYLTRYPAPACAPLLEIAQTQRRSLSGVTAAAAITTTAPEATSPGKAVASAASATTTTTVAVSHSVSEVRPAGSSPLQRLVNATTGKASPLLREGSSSHSGTTPTQQHSPQSPVQAVADDRELTTNGSPHVPSIAVSGHSSSHPYSAEDQSVPALQQQLEACVSVATSSSDYEHVLHQLQVTSGGKSKRKGKNRNATY